jgi:hypothetical protein
MKQNINSFSKKWQTHEFLKLPWACLIRENKWMGEIKKIVQLHFEK